MSTDKNNNAILAQSGQFNITGGGSSNNAAAGSSSGTPPVTLTNGVTNGAVAKPSETVVTSLPAGYTGNAASGGIPNAVSAEARSKLVLRTFYLYHVPLLTHLRFPPVELRPRHSVSLAPLSASSSQLLACSVS